MKMTKLIAIVLAVSSMLTVSALAVSAASTTNITVKVNDTVIRFPDQKPIVQNERTLVPVRFVAEALGYDVEWNAKDNTAVIDSGKIILYIGTNKAEINGKSVTLDVASTVVHNRTMVPLRVVAETLNCSVDWIGETKTVLVNAKKNGRELSLYERLKQTGLYYDVKDIRSCEHTRFLVRKDAVVKAPTESTPADLGLTWWIEAPNVYDVEQYPATDLALRMTDYSTSTRKEVEQLLEMFYPTGYEEVSSLMMQTLRGEIWETRMDWHPAGFMTPPGTIGKRYYDQREVYMTINGNIHTFSMTISTAGYVNPDKPIMLDANTVNVMKQDYQLGLWPEDIMALNLK
ncbi:MAG: copper amine oxidase N-terminal domain-containing protein [Clostridia bacterium]|nr:copper amine oxidase N-terminal domain-containing protein [Clostridia bacterium]